MFDRKILMWVAQGGDSLWGVRMAGPKLSQAKDFDDQTQCSCLIGATGSLWTSELVYVQMGIVALLGGELTRSWRWQMMFLEPIKILHLRPKYAIQQVEVGGNVHTSKRAVRAQTPAERVLCPSSGTTSCSHSYAFQYKIDNTEVDIAIKLSLLKTQSHNKELIFIWILRHDCSRNLACEELANGFALRAASTKDGCRSKVSQWKEPVFVWVWKSMIAVGPRIRVL
ncbi:predicted protein [Histoplasma capsulatum var. duboisii H88]|uniref:Predicted protein n=1 Tax=Ajellomyces capsulatus (strain H88) TaxID=544711 RepID=F0UV42_AJEC8|nr:predicted protein [Histoplasma capsulatum var. duboisii H88]